MPQLLTNDFDWSLPEEVQAYIVDETMVYFNIHAWLSSMMKPDFFFGGRDEILTATAKAKANESDVGT